MQFIAIGKDICLAITKLQRLTGNKSEVFRITADKKSLFIHTNISPRKAAATVPVADVKGKIDFTISAEILNGICKNRQGLTFKIVDNQLNASEVKTKYRVDRILLSPDMQGEVVTPNKELDKVESIDSKLLTTTIKSCLIKPMFNETPLALTLQLRDKEFLIGVADNFHGALAYIKLDKKSRNVLTKQNWQKAVTLPVEYAEFIVNNFDSAKLVIRTNSKVIRLQSPDLCAELPTLQTTTIPLDDILKVPRQVEKIHFTLDAKELQTVVNNIHTVKENNVPFILRFKKNSPELELIFKSTTGRVRDTVMLKQSQLPKKSMDLLIETNNFVDIARKLEGKTNVHFNDTLIMFSNKTKNLRKFYFAILLQDDTKNEG